MDKRLIFLIIVMFIIPFVVADTLTASNINTSVQLADGCTFSSFTVNQNWIFFDNIDTSDCNIYNTTSENYYPNVGVTDINFTDNNNIYYINYSSENGTVNTSLDSGLELYLPFNNHINIPLSSSEFVSPGFGGTIYNNYSSKFSRDIYIKYNNGSKYYFPSNLSNNPIMLKYTYSSGSDSFTDSYYDGTDWVLIRTYDLLGSPFNTTQLYRDGRGIADESGNDIYTSYVYTNDAVAGYDFVIYQDSSDIIGSNDGIDTNMVYTSQGAQFIRGDNTYITLTSDIVLDKDSATLVMEFNPNVDGSSIYYMLGNSGTITQSYCRITSNIFDCESDTNADFWTNNIPYNNNSSNYITLSADNGNVSTYINGIFYSSKIANDDLTLNMFGTSTTGTANKYNGLIKKIQTFNTSLSSDEVLNLYNGGNFTLDKNENENKSKGFNGDSAILVRNNNTLNNNSMTISTWVKVNNHVVSGSENIFGHFKNMNRTYIGINNTHFTMAMGDYVFIPLSPLDYNWHNIVLTKNNTNYTAYIDGVNVYSNTTNTLKGFEDYFGIGSLVYAPGVVNKFNGTIDEVRIYNRTLTQTEISNFIGSVTCGIISNDSNVNCVNTTTTAGTTTITCNALNVDNTVLLQPFCLDSETTLYSPSKALKVDLTPNIYLYGYNIWNKSNINSLSATVIGANGTTSYNTNNGNLSIDLNCSGLSNITLSSNNYINNYILRDVSCGNRSSYQNNYSFYQSVIRANTLENGSNADLNNITFVVNGSGITNTTFDSDGYLVFYTNAGSINIKGSNNFHNQTAQLLNLSIGDNVSVTVLSSYNGTMTFNVYDADTLLPITLENISIDLYNSLNNYSNSINTNNATSSVSIKNMSAGEVRITAYGSDYNVNTIFYTMPNTNQNNALNLYLTNSTSNNIIDLIVEVRNNVDNVYPNIEVRVYRQEGVNFNLITSPITNYNGQVVVQLVKDSVYYKFVGYVGDEQCFSTDPYIITANDEKFIFDCIVGTNYIERYNQLYDVQYNLYAVNNSNTTGYFYLEANSSYEESEYCLNVYEQPFILNSLFIQNCSSGLATILTAYVNSTSDKMYKATFEFKPPIENDYVAIESIYLEFDFNNFPNFGNFGILFLIIIITAVVIALASEPAIQVMASSIAVAVSVWLRVIPVAEHFRFMTIISAITLGGLIAWLVETRFK